MTSLKQSFLNFKLCCLRLLLMLTGSLQVQGDTQDYVYVVPQVLSAVQASMAPAMSGYEKPCEANNQCAQSECCKPESDGYYTCAAIGYDPRHCLPDTPDKDGPKKCVSSRECSGSQGCCAYESYMQDYFCISSSGVASRDDSGVSGRGIIFPGEADTGETVTTSATRSPIYRTPPPLPAYNYDKYPPPPPAPPSTMYQPYPIYVPYPLQSKYPPPLPPPPIKYYLPPTKYPQLPLPPPVKYYQLPPPMKYNPASTKYPLPLTKYYQTVPPPPSPPPLPIKYYPPSTKYLPPLPPMKYYYPTAPPPLPPPQPPIEYYPPPSKYPTPPPYPTKYPVMPTALPPYCLP